MTTDIERNPTEYAGAQAGIRLVEHRKCGLDFKLALLDGEPDHFHTWTAANAAWTDIHELMLSLARPGETVVDAGANIGTVTIPLAASGANVVAYECLPENVRVLKAAVDANGFSDRVTVREMALWDEPAKLSFTGRSAWGRADAEGKLRVPAGPLDDDLPAGDKVSVVKLDVEGAEQHVLRGMRRLIATRKPDIVFEGNPMELGRLGSSLADIFALLRSYGYRIYRIYALNRLLSPAGVPQEMAVTDYLATVRRRPALRWRTGNRVGRIMPRHIKRRVLEFSDDWWQNHMQFLVAADGMPASVLRDRDIVARLAEWRERYTGHPMLETFWRGNFGRADHDVSGARIGNWVRSR